MKKDIIIETVHESGIKIPEKQIEMFARRLLPEIKQYFADEKVKKDFQEWQNRRKGNKIK